MFIMKIIRSVRAVPVIIAAVLMLHGPGRAEPAGDAAADSPEALQKAILDDKALLREEIKKAEGLLAGAAGDEERRFYAELLDQLQNINVIYEQQLVQVKRSPELSQALEKRVEIVEHRGIDRIEVGGAVQRDGENARPRRLAAQRGKVGISAHFLASCFFASIARNSRRRIFPTALLGSASRNSICLGTL